MDDPYEDSVTGCFEGGCGSLWRMYVEMTSDSIAEGKNNNNENDRVNKAKLDANDNDTHHVNKNVFNVNEQIKISRKGRKELIDTQDGVLGCHRTEVSTYFIRNQNFVEFSSIETEEKSREEPIERQLYSSIRNYVTPNRQRY
jgi:hypothetical protein